MQKRKDQKLIELHVTLCDYSNFNSTFTALNLCQRADSNEQNIIHIHGIMLCERREQIIKFHREDI